MPKIIWWPQMAGGFFSKKSPKLKRFTFLPITSINPSQPINKHHPTGTLCCLPSFLNLEKTGSWVILESQVAAFILAAVSTTSHSVDMAKKTPQRIVQRNQKCSEGNAKKHVCWVPVVWFWLFAKRHADFPKETKKNAQNSNPKFDTYRVYLIKIFKFFFCPKSIDMPQSPRRKKIRKTPYWSPPRGAAAVR